MISPSLITAIWIFRMLQVPQGAAACHCRNRRKVIGRGRRRCGPFQRPCVPRVVTGPGSLEIRNDEVGNEQENCEGLNERADCDEQVQGIPTTAGLIRVDSPWHPQNARNVHHVERQVKANKEKPEMPIAQTLAQHSTSHLGIPVIERREEREQNSAYDYIMKVRHYKIRQAKLPIEGRGGHHDASQTGDEKLE